MKRNNEMRERKEWKGKMREGCREKEGEWRDKEKQLLKGRNVRENDEMRERKRRNGRGKMREVCEGTKKESRSRGKSSF